MTPLERKFRGVGGLIGRTIRGRGMDIFWNHTICFHNKFILPTKVIDTVSYFNPLVTRA